MFLWWAQKWGQISTSKRSHLCLNHWRFTVLRVKVKMPYLATAINARSTFKPVLALVSMNATLWSWKKQIKGNRCTFWGGNYQKWFASLLKKGIYLCRQEFVPIAKSFVLGQNPFQKALCVQESKQEVTKVVSLVKNGGKCTRCIQAP